MAFLAILFGIFIGALFVYWGSYFVLAGIGLIAGAVFSLLGIPTKKDKTE